MANYIDNGEYYLFNAANTNTVLDIAGSAITSSNTRMELWEPLKNNAQSWQIKNMTTENEISITSRIYGRRFSPVDGSATAQVVLNATNSNTSATWKIEATGNNITVEGESYPTYYIKRGNLNLYAEGSTKGSNVRMSTGTSNQAQWAFVPIRQVNDKGLFEIRSILDPKMALDVENHGTINGTNIQIYPGTGYNNQKFVIEKRAQDQYAIRCLGSGKYVDVDSAIAANRQNIRIWEDNNTIAQRWKIYEYGMTKHDGLDCMIVAFGSYVTPNADTYFMDVHAGNMQPFENIRLFQNMENDAQRFLLQPTEAEDTNMPSPNSLGIATAVGNNNTTSYGYTNGYIVPSWHCSAAWCSDNGINHYQIRYRSRKMKSITSVWQSWTGWSEWFIPAVKTAGTRVWYNDIEMTPEYQWSEAKNQELEIQVRCSGADDLELLHSAAIDKVFNIYRRPQITFSDIGWSINGMTVSFETDYTYGTTYLYIDSIKDGGINGEELLKEPITIEAYKQFSSYVIDREKLTHWAQDGTNLFITFRVGYDQQKICDGSDIAIKTLKYDAGTIDVEPILEGDEGHYHAKVPHLGEERVWVAYQGEVFECPLLEINGDYSIFEVLYPVTGAEFALFTEARASDGIKWGTDITITKYTYITYAWTVGTNTKFLRVSVGDNPTFSHTHDATYQSDKLDQRKHSSVSFAKTRTDNMTAAGVLVHDEKYKDDETVQDFEELVGTHAIFRDHYGGIHNVAVVSVSIDEHYAYDDIVVTMIEESI